MEIAPKRVESHAGAADAHTAPLLAPAFALAVFVWLSFSRAIFNDGDTSWHLAAGRLILDSRSVPGSDPFSFTFEGAAWTAHEWLAEAVMAAAWQLGSWSGLALLFAGAMAALVLLLGRELGRWLSPAQTAIALLAAIIVLTPFILARPHVLAWPLLAWWAILLMRAREAERAPPAVAALAMLAWANLHGSFLFGLALAGVFALEALLASPDRRAALLGWGRFGLLCLAAALATPHGIDGLLFPFRVSAMETLPLIIEWRPTVLSEAGGFQAVLLGTLFLLLLLGVRVPPLRLLLLVGLVFLAFQHARHQALLGILGPLLLAAPLARVLEGREASRGATAIRRNAGAIAAALLLAVAAVRLALPMAPGDSRSNPVSAIAAVPDGLRDRPVLNSYGFGGPLILAGIRPHIDGRADMYGDAFMIAHERMVRGDLEAFAEAVERWGIAWTILEPDAPLARALDRDTGWTRIYGDELAVVHARSRAGGD